MDGSMRGGDKGSGFVEVELGEGEHLKLAHFKSEYFGESCLAKCCSVNQQCIGLDNLFFYRVPVQI